MSECVNPAIFRAYDIRGVVDIDLTDTTVTTLGRAVGTFFRRRNVATMVVGRDARLSSPRFQTILNMALAASGIRVIDIGEVPTPVMYFALEHLGADAGAVMSASHNPAEYNGIKLRQANADYGSEALSSEDIQQIEQIANGGQFVEGQATLHQADIRDIYVQHVASTLRLSQWSGPEGRTTPRVVLDGGNGVAGPLGVRVLEAIGAEVIPLYIEPDGRFPNHHPDPLKAENLHDLSEAVRTHKADLGIALDGDGDRLGVVDSTGAVVWADRYLIVLARHMLTQRKGPVVFDVKCGTVLRDAIKACGGTPVMWKTGYSNLSAKMRELDAVFGGELSGHIIFPYPGHYFDDGAFAGAHLLYTLAYLQAQGMLSTASLAEALAPYPVLPMLTEERLPFADATKFQAIAYLQRHFANQYPVVDIDGVRVDFGDGWGLVRPSNTEPALTTRFEAQTEARLYAIRDQMLAVIQDFEQIGT